MEFKGNRKTSFAFLNEQQKLYSKTKIEINEEMQIILSLPLIQQ